MKRFLLSGLLVTISSFAFSQNIDAIISKAEVERIEKTLAADDMQGRKTFTPSIDKAADFISAEFKKAGLQTVNNSGSYLQQFLMIRPKFVSATAYWNNKPLETNNITFFTSQPELKVTEKDGYETVSIKADDNFFEKAMEYVNSKKNQIVIVDTALAQNFKRLPGLKRYLFKSAYNTVFVLAPASASTYSFEAKHEIVEFKLSNVVGVLPGKKKKDEYVIYSGHYDHLGVYKPVNGDSIYNGANDDASGTTAVIMLANYFKALNNNERTIIFTAFTAEEIGGFGSQYFSQQYNPDKVVAMFNIEMIGTESKWGLNSAYITGYEKTNMGKILEKNLVGTNFKFYPDPYTEQQLFYRSDNATLARLGVPAHTISTSKMDNEANYHKASDEFETLDMNNMTNIIKSIALSSGTIINGKDTPSRVNVTELKKQ
ncbi:M28 family peptidase [Solitalea koreensis]|uniref:Peptidase family M28 n=1 Tax=Solitalea koreensis TaxID=543615 RepID=A0A521C1N5_9SPHI|nr:M28 family peptidase [Solitalea koreensis]SMO53387.1 Peptidase family M28 [Solitalea koreensis]